MKLQYNSLQQEKDDLESQLLFMPLKQTKEHKILAKKYWELKDKNIPDMVYKNTPPPGMVCMHSYN